MNPQHMVVEVLQHSAPLPETSVEQELFVKPEVAVKQQLHPTNGSQLPSEQKHITPCDTSDDHDHRETQACVSACLFSSFRTALLCLGHHYRAGA